MKKVTLCLVAALTMATSGFAQTGQKRVVGMPGTTKTIFKDAKATPKKAELQKQKSSPQVLRSQLKNRATTGLPKAPWQLKGMKKDITGSYISKQPAGEYVSYSHSGEAYAYSYWGPLYTTVDGAVSEVVFGSDNKVYIKGAISQSPIALNGWIEGTLNGSTITFEVPAKVANYGYYELYAVMMNYDAEQRTYVYDAEQTSFTLNYDAATRTISTPEGTDLATGDTILGLAWGDDESWVGSGDWNMTFEVMTDEPVTAPEGLATEQYSLVADGFTGTLVNVGFDGSDVYVQGIYPNLPEAWAKGTIEGDKVTFANNQYLGADQATGYHEYLVSGTAEELYDDYRDEYYTSYALADNDIVFDYDAAKKTLSNGSLFFVNAGTNSVYYAEVYDQARMAPFTEVAATPAAPEWIDLYEGGYDYYADGWGWGDFHFNMVTADTEGNYILPEKLSYAFYARVNGEEIPLTFDPEDYYYLDEEMTEVPFGFSDSNGWDISCSGLEMYVYYYIIGPEAFGIQAIYRGAGEEHRSEIAWQEVQELGAEVQPEAATPAYPELDPANVGSSIDFSYYTGTEKVDVWGESKAQTYDVAIRLNEPALTGSHIDNIQIPLQGLESMKDVKVWLSSQLRVEGGKNVPDLLSIDVTPNEEGFTVVTLDKPYTIPAEGVYVGYSVTIDEVLGDDAESPIVVCDNNKADGLYLHTTKGFVKWLNMAGIMGMNSMIRVSVSGKEIAADDVYAEDGQTKYVKVGEPIEQNVTFVNRGANGIKSLDLEMTLNGTTTEQHIDLAEPVEGAFGLATTQTVKLPAINERGNYELGLKVVKVNGVDNAEAEAVATTPYVVLNSVPVHRTMMEEYTGTWCGWCVRGYVGLEKLAERYPDDFVCASFHNGDDMEVISSDYYPWNEYKLGNFPGFPTAAMDRMAEIDPFWGFDYGKTPMGVAADLAERAKEFGHASIDLETSMDADNDVVTVNTTVTFPFDDTDADDERYSLEYLLLANGLTGEGSAWAQSNYYSGSYDEACDELMPFIEAESSVSGLVFNDVVVMVSEIGGIEGSLPATFNADEPVAHTYTFDLSGALNTKGAYVIQDKNQLYVVAMLIDNWTGEVCNAIKVKVGESTGISTLSDDLNNIRSIEYFDLSGRKLNRAQQGVCIMRLNYNNGTHKAVKVMQK